MPGIVPMLREVVAAAEPVRLTVVVCGDAPEFVAGLVRSLARLGQIDIVAVAINAEEVEQVVRRSLPDLALIDLRRPVDVIDATRRVRAASPTTRVAILTSTDRSRGAYDALRAGAFGYVNKNAGVAEIASAIQTISRGQYAIPAHLAPQVRRDLERASAITLGEAERGILEAAGEGQTNAEIGRRLHLSESAVYRRIGDIFSKLQLADQLDSLRAHHGAGR